jgi:serine/threonine-protein kinase
LPADRFASAAEYAAALAAATGARTVTRAGATAGPMGLSRRATGAIMAGLAVVAIGALAWALLGRTRPEPTARVARFEVAMAPGEELVSPGGTRFAWSPDGSEFVYTGAAGAGTMLWSRRLDALEATPIRGSDGATSPTYSPDGREIAFLTVAPFSVRVIPRSGGAARVLVDRSYAAGGGLAWAEDGLLYFDGGTGLARVKPDGSGVEMAMPLDTTMGELGMAWPRALPQGRGILMRVRRSGEAMADWSIVAFDLQDQSRKALVRGVFATYSPDTQHLLWVTADGSLMAQPFDLDRLMLGGDPVQLLDGLSVSGSFGATDVALSPAGDLLYVAGSSTSNLGKLSWVDRRGTASVADSTGIDGLLRGMALSPDGATVALAMERATDANYFGRIWVTAMRGEPLQLVTTEPQSAVLPTWDRDSRSLLYVGDEGTTIYRRRTDGSGSAEIVANVPRGVIGMTIHPSGKSLLLIGEDSGERRRELLDLQLEGDRVPTVLPIPIGVNRELPTFSPDGRWLAYVSPLGGRDDVYVSPYPDIDAGRVQVSANGGGAPRWNRQGGELFYLSDAGAVVSVRFTTTDGFRILSTEELFTPSGFRSGEGRVFYDPAPDGQRFLMFDISGETTGAGATRPIVVQNFTAELRAMVPP